MIRFHRGGFTATIGIFTKSENGYAGSVRTLTVNTKVRFAPAEKEKERSPRKASPWARPQASRIR